jgi:hypothetical protein
MGFFRTIHVTRDAGLERFKKSRVRAVQGDTEREKPSAACGQHEVAFKGYEDVPTSYRHANDCREAA